MKQHHGTRKYSFVITHNEINERHGVAILIRNIFAQGKGILTIRSTNDYDGNQTFGDVNLHISHKGQLSTEIIDESKDKYHLKIVKIKQVTIRH